MNWNLLWIALGAAGSVRSFFLFKDRDNLRGFLLGILSGYVLALGIFNIIHQ